MDKILVWLFPLSLISYLIYILRIIHTIKKKHPEYWNSIGAPSLSDPNGQIKILKVILVPNCMPEKISEDYKIEKFVVRLLFFIASGCFIIIFWGSINGASS
ncbi:hypothetical protein [Nevskia sp.]|uniref:hypothetical protein n=1 Tax=Nevskia sp. TaxID=1929292 RepID=UPI0025F9AFE6|nr:hypothetical protein [Nevskia sp.]